MKKLFYLPTEESKRVLWLNNFSGKLKDTYAAIFSISSATADKVVDYAAFYAFLIGYVTGLRTFMQDLTKYKNTFFGAPLNTPNGALPINSITPPATIPTEAGAFTIISGIIKTIKAHPLYNENIGEDLGIVGNEESLDLDTYKPEGTAIAMPGSVKLEFSKKGVDGQAIYSHPVGGTNPNEWVRIGIDYHSPYADGRALANLDSPENREYKLRGVIGDEEVGQFSDVIKATFAG